MASLKRELTRRNLSVLLCTVNPTAAAAGLGKYLPKGAVPLAIQSFGGATGGSSPTIDVGVSGAAASWKNELDADTPTAPLVLESAVAGVALADDTEVWAGVGASAATGGTSKFAIYYAIKDASVDGAGE